MPRGKLPRITPGKFSAVIRAYQESEKFARLAENTKAGYRRVLRLAEHPSLLGEIPVDEIDPYLVQIFLDGLDDRPAVQQRAKVALKSLESWAILRRQLPRSITLGVETVGSKGAREPWTEAEVELATKFARPDLRRVVLMAAWTGQRIGDLCDLKWSAFRVYRGRLGVDITQQKTHRPLWVPIFPELEQAIETWERRSIYVLTTMRGLKWTRPRLSQDWWVERRKNEALAPLNERKLSLHGLRATAVVRLRRAGVSRPLIADCVGMSGSMVDLYCRRSDQADNALAAMGMTRTAEIVPFKEAER